MKVKTSELIDATLDFAVALAKDESVRVERGRVRFALSQFTNHYDLYAPSTDWAQGGPIIERELIHTYPRFTAGRTEGGSDVYQQDGWAAYVTPPAFWVTPRPFTGPTPLIAAMRCYVASNLGDNVDVPEELL